MKKAIVILAAFCAISASAKDMTAARMLAERVWNITEDTVLPEPVVSTAKTSHGYTVNVACDLFTNAFDTAEPPAVLFPGMTFVVSGYIYPDGTFAGNDLNGGVNDDGGNAWADLTIGTWICRGWIYVPGAITTQTFDLGEDMLITDGWENSTTAVVTRSITGGMGAYSHARGEITQSIIGINASTAPNFQMEFHFRKEINFKN